MKLTALGASDGARQLIPVFGVHLEQERTYGPREGSVAQHPRLRGNDDVVHRHGILASEADECGPGGLRVEFRASRLLRQGGQESRRPASSRKAASSKGMRCSAGSTDHWSTKRLAPGVMNRNASRF
jgi:hypothetical protein